MYQYICKYCKKEIKVENSKIFANHVRWCDKNPKRNNTENISIAAYKVNEKKYGKLIIITKNCPICNKEFSYEKKCMIYLKKHGKMKNMLKKYCQ